jgi:hypothetical protein
MIFFRGVQREEDSSVKLWLFDRFLAGFATLVLFGPALELVVELS